MIKLTLKCNGLAICIRAHMLWAVEQKECGGSVVLFGREQDECYYVRESVETVLDLIAEEVAKWQA